MVLFSPIVIFYIHINMKNKVMKETINVLKSMKGMDEMNTTEIQFYITDADGFILELCIGIDEDGETYKNFNQYDRSEERRVGKECRSRWSPYQ